MGGGMWDKGSRFLPLGFGILKVGLREIPPNVGKAERGVMMKYGTGLLKAALHPPSQHPAQGEGRIQAVPSEPRNIPHPQGTSDLRVTRVPTSPVSPRSTLPSRKALRAEGEGASPRGPQILPLLYHHN